MEYGDESVAELVNIQLSIQNVSNITAKLIEESRIGLSRFIRNMFLSKLEKGFFGIVKTFMLLEQSTHQLGSASDFS